MFCLQAFLMFLWYATHAGAQAGCVSGASGRYFVVSLTRVVPSIDKVKSCAPRPVAE